MSIIIPSKHIYAKENSKVIDNQIDKVEVQAKEPQLINATENVYNEQIENSLTTDGGVQDKIVGENGAYLQGSARYYQAIVAYVKLEPKYLKKVFTIPKNIGNTTIIEMLSGVNDNGDANIKYSLFGIVEKGTATATATATLPDITKEQLTKTTYTLSSNIQKEPPQPISSGSYTLSKDITDRNYSITEYIQGGGASGGNPYHTVTVEIPLKNDSNIFTATFEKKENSFIIDLTLLSGLNIVEIGGTSRVLENSLSSYGSFSVPLNGTYYHYIPTQLNISFYGDIIKLDLQNKTVAIGNGSYVMSFDGNELMQTTNSPTIKEKYQSTINQYQDGKQTATLRCGIEDYYDNNGNLAVSKDRQNNLPMTFHIDDIVVPYIYGAKGEDKPLSLNKDGSPKTFEVLGKKIIYDGGIWQELSLQEYSGEIKTTTQRVIVQTGTVGQLQPDGSTLYIGSTTIEFTEGKVVNVSVGTLSNASVSFKDNSITVTARSTAPNSREFVFITITYLSFD